MIRVYSIILLSVLLWIDAVARPDPAEFKAVDRIVVVGDVHGDFERFKAVLESADLIDSKLKWKGGETHLVQLGDIPDRGPDTREIYGFMKKLERDARRAGGRVHSLIGNHDAMNMYGDLRFVIEEEFNAFASRRSERLLEDLYKEEVAWMKANLLEAQLPEFDETFKEQWLSNKPPGYVEHRLAWLPDGEMGKWILTKNALLKIGDSLFLHAGISPDFADKSISDINEEVRDTLTRLDSTRGNILRREDGPLWYRGLALHNEAQEEAHVDQVLENFEVSRIVVGHTPTPGVIVPRFNGKVILADVGLSRYYGDHLACLEISKGETYAIHRGKRLKLPDVNSESFVDYLEAINELEPNNKEAQAWIGRLKKAMAEKG